MARNMCFLLWMTLTQMYGYYRSWGEQAFSDVSIGRVYNTKLYTRFNTKMVGVLPDNSQYLLSLHSVHV